MSHTAHADPEQLIERYETPEDLAKKIDLLADFVRNSKRTASFTGAGISTSAGIADFRGPKGVWTLRAQGKGSEIKSVSTLSAFPTKTHMGLIALHRANLLHFLISQNCDGLHRKSGFPPDSLAELHGNGNMEECEKCATRFYRDFKCWRLGRGSDHFTGRYCGLCSGRLLEWTIDFGQTLPMDQLHRADEQSEEAKLHIAWGSSLTVTPAADCPKTTKKRGGKLVIVNLQKTPLDKHADLIIHEKTDKVMEELCKRLNIEIPKWQLLRRLLVDVTDTGDVTVQGVDRYQRLPASLFQKVTLQVGEDVYDAHSQEPIVFTVDQDKVTTDVDAKLHLVWQGHYAEPDLTLDTVLKPGTWEYRLDYDPFEKEWTIVQPATAVDSKLLPPIARGGNVVPHNTCTTYDLPNAPGCWATASLVTVNRKRCVAIIGGRDNRLMLLDASNGNLVKNYDFQEGDQSYISKARWGHSACVLNENIAKILLFGGWDSDCQYSDLNLMDASTGAIKSVQTLGDGPSARSCHSAVITFVKGDPTLFIFGGACCVNGPYDYYDDMWSLSLSKFEWKKVECKGHIPSPRAQHSMAVRNEQYIFVTGGYNGTEVLDDMYIFNMGNANWTRVAQHIGTSGCGMTYKSDVAQPNFRVPAIRHCAAIIKGTSMVLAGQWGISAMNLGTATWTKKVLPQDQPLPQLAGHCVCSNGDEMWLVGGNDTDGDNSKVYHVKLPRL